jgi:hypothetical protein
MCHSGLHQNQALVVYDPVVSNVGTDVSTWIALGEQVKARKLRQQKDDSSQGTSPSSGSPPAEVYQSFRCCNSTIVLEMYAQYQNLDLNSEGEGCAGEPSFSGSVTMDLFSGFSGCQPGNFEMVCPMGGTGSPFVRAYGNGTCYLPSGGLKRV